MSQCFRVTYYFPRDMEFKNVLYLAAKFPSHALKLCALVEQITILTCESL